MQMRSDSGLTLVELLVALTVTALMLTAVYQTVSSASIAREKLAVSNARHHIARIVTERIGRELLSLHYVASDERTRFSGGLGGGDMELLVFTTTASTPLAREPGLPARVVYRLEVDRDADDNAYRLTRTETSALDFDTGRAYRLADGLSEIEISFLNNGDWLNRWDSLSTQGLPEAVALSLRFGDIETGNDFRTVWTIGDE
ncbi:MAG: hypothetical protein C0623_14560 [Desulfuromonas sp.]|nr:MAG: hypothetical protein C0623_14560 [Desulfuromonas sp.]